MYSNTKKYAVQTKENLTDFAKGLLSGVKAVFTATATACSVVADTAELAKNKLEEAKANKKLFKEFLEYKNKESEAK